MPCYTVVEITSTSVLDTKGKDRGRLVAAARENNMTIDFVGDRATLRKRSYDTRYDEKEMARQVTQTYARLTVEAGLKRSGIGLRIKQSEQVAETGSIKLTVGR